MLGFLLFVVYLVGALNAFILVEAWLALCPDPALVGQWRRWRVPALILWPAGTLALALLKWWRW